MDGYRDWRQKRRDRTRLLIEYGGLVVKSELMPLLGHDTAVLLGALLALRDQLAGLSDDRPADLMIRWRRRGLRAFDADAAAKHAARAEQKPAQNWGQDRRERTRRLIQYGALVEKAALMLRLDDDRATLLGGLLALRDQLGGDDEHPAALKARWQCRGLCALEVTTAEKQAGEAAEGPPAKAGATSADANQRKGQ